MERVRCLEPHEFMKDFHVKDLLVFHRDARLSHTQLVADLHILLQDKVGEEIVVDIFAFVSFLE